MDTVYYGLIACLGIGSAAYALCSPPVRDYVFNRHIYNRVMASMEAGDTITFGELVENLRHTE